MSPIDRKRAPDSSCGTASRSRSSASGSSRCRRRRPPRSSRGRSLPATATSTRPRPTATRPTSARPSTPRASTATRSSSPPSASTTTTATTRPSARSRTSLDRLEMEHVDLYLIHWPVPVPGPLRRDLAGVHRGAGGGPGARRSACRTSSPPTCAGSIDETGVTPAVNQIELHPRPPAARPAPRARRARGIVTEAWSPLAQGRCSTTRRSWRSPRRTAGRPAQVVLRWHIQLGNVVFPKSVTPRAASRRTSTSSTSSSSSDEMEAIEALDARRADGPGSGHVRAP